MLDCRWLVAFCGALTYAEIGSRLPVTGGYYKVFSYAYHPSIAFAINCIILVSNAASCAAVALVGSEYISSVLIPASKDAAYMSAAANAEFVKTVQVIIALVAIVFFYVVNMLGITNECQNPIGADDDQNRYGAAVNCAAVFCNQ